MSLYHHQNGDCDSYTCRYCEWDDQQEAAERAHAGEDTEEDEPESICPECQQGKHGNCDGTAWDNDRDEPTDCQCDEGTCK